MYPDLSEILASLHVVRLPMRTHFRGVDHREVAIFRGPFGWGEFSPFLEYDAVESSNWLRAGIEAAFEAPLPTFRSTVAINATLPAIDDPKRIEEVISWYPGAKTIKIKVTGDLASDRARITAVRDLYPEISIRLDFNGSLSFEDAVRILEPLKDEIEYVEQPCESIEEVRELKRLIDIKVAVDEGVRKSADPLALDLDGAADLLILKVSPLGGIKRALAIADHYKLPVVISSALESAVGISHGLHLAAMIEEERAAGLATGALFTADLSRHVIEAGKMEVRSISTIDQSALDSLAVEADRFTWWQDRLRESYEVLIS